MYVGDYAEQDAALTLKLWHHLKALIKKEEVESIFTLETELLPILIDLTYQGIRFDRPKCEQLIDEFKRKELEHIKQIKSLSGEKVDIWAAASIAKAFDKLSLP